MSKPGSKPRAAVGRRSIAAGPARPDPSDGAAARQPARCNDAALAEFGTVPPFPPDAGRLLTEARRTMVEGRPRWR